MRRQHRSRLVTGLYAMVSLISSRSRYCAKHLHHTTPHLTRLSPAQDETKAAKEAEWEAIQAKAKMRRDPVAWEAEINKRRIKEAEMRAAQAQQELSEPGEALQQNLPEGWASAVDSTSGDTYYYNKAKGLNQWQRPTE